MFLSDELVKYLYELLYVIENEKHLGIFLSIDQKMKSKIWTRIAQDKQSKFKHFSIPVLLLGASVMSDFDLIDVKSRKNKK